MCIVNILQTGNASNRKIAEQSQKTFLNNNGLVFIENKGQIIDAEGHLRSDILYKGQTAGTDIYIRKTGFSYVLNQTEAVANTEGRNSTPEETIKAENISIKLHRIDIDFEGCNSDVQVIHGRQVAGHSNYYYPHCPQGITYVYSYNEVLVKNIYPNIDIKYYGGTEGGMKYDIIINPGGDPSQIKMKYGGQEKLKIESILGRERLKITYSFGDMIETLPRVYQNIREKIVDVKAEYHIVSSSNSSATLNFKLSNFKHDYPLVIDPWITYYGGSNWDRCASIATDNNGDVVITGNTSSSDFPIQGASQSSNGGGSWDGIVVKFTNAGVRVFATYLGGSDNDFTNGVEINSANIIFVTGGTNSTNLSTVNPGGGAYYQPTYNGGAGFATGDAYIAEFTPAGTLTWLTYYGGSSEDVGYDLAIDNSDNVYITGYTKSPNFPVFTAYQGTPNGNNDGFVAKFNSSRAQVWSTYYGGSQNDGADAITTDPLGNVVIGGVTFSDVNFPIVAAHQPVIGSTSSTTGDGDAFVAKLNGSTGFPIWSTYYGGNGNFGESTYAVAVDSLGNVYAGGQTRSTNNISSAGAFQVSNSGGSGYDGFIVKFSSAGVRQWGTFIGGSAGWGQDYVTGLACDANNNLIVVGDTYASDFPTTPCSYQTTFAPPECQFIANFYPNGTLMCSGVLGNSGGGDKETWHAPALGGSLALYGCNLFINAMSFCEYPTTIGCFQGTCNGGIDISVAKLYIYTCGGTNTASADFSANPTTICQGKSVSFTSSYTACDTVGLLYNWTFAGGTPQTSTLKNPIITYSTAGTYGVQLAFTNHCKNDTIVKPSYITVTAPFSSTITSSPATCSGINDGTASITAGGTPPFTYNWSNAQTTQSISGLAAGTYTVIIFDNTNCLSTNTVTITQSSALLDNPTIANASCGASDGSITLNPSGGNSPYTYAWSNSQTTSSASNLPAGVYTITITDGNNCSITSVQTITTAISGTISITSSDNSCSGSNDGVATATVTGGSSPFTYNWSNAQTSQSITNLSPGIYTVTVTDNNNCVATNSIIITQPVLLAASITSPSVVCLGQSIILSALGSGGTPAYSYQWNTGNTNSGMVELPTTNVVYSVTITDNKGCSHDTSISITVISVSVDAGDGATIEGGESLTLSASGGGAISWLPSTSCSCLSPVVTPTATTTYTIMANDNGCVVWDTVTVFVETNECDESKAFVPNAFSPNNDSENDNLKLYFTGIPETIYFVVYNRWGEKVFETTDQKSIWDGRYKGKLLDAGVFSYVLKINCSATNSGTIKTGIINLMR